MIGGISLMFYLGCFFLWGNIDVYVLSYFHEFNPNLSVGFIFIVDTLLIAANSTGYNIGTYLLTSRNWHPKLILVIGGTLALSGTYMSSYTKKLAPYLSLYTGMNGIGCGMCYFVPLVCSWEYFPSKKGLMTGIIIGAYGFGSFIFSLISTKLVNPDHLQPTIVDGDMKYFAPEVADRVPYMIRTLCYIWIGLVCLSILLITRQPKPAKDSLEESLEQIPDLQSLQPEIRHVKFCVFSKRFWQYYFLMIGGNFFSTFFAYTYKVYGENQGISDQTLTWAASIGGGLVNGLARFIMGWLQDKVSFRTLMMGLMTVQLSISLVVYWLAAVPSLYFIAVVMNYFCSGGLFAVFPGSVTNLFGLNKGPQIYSIILTASIVSSSLNLLMTELLLPATGFLACFFVGSGMTVIVLIILWRFQEKLDIENLSRV